MSAPHSAHIHLVPATQGPLVSIGVPVRNGAEFLEEALQLLVEQTHANLEIIISDNASNDGSVDIIERFANNDCRIKVYKQLHILTALENFRFVFERTSGDYFMWAACDDRRSLNNVQRLLAAIQAHPEASLAFGDVAEFSDFTQWQSATPMPYPFETQPNESKYERLRRYTRINCLHVYGLIRRDALQSYEWLDIDNGPDIPLLVHLAFIGEFVRAEGGCFYYHAPPVTKSLVERALANSLRRLRPLPEARLAWACALVAHRAAKQTGTRMPLFVSFALAYWNRHWRWLKPRLFALLPGIFVNVYRKRFKRPSV